MYTFVAKLHACVWKRLSVWNELKFSALWNNSHTQIWQRPMGSSGPQGYVLISSGLWQVPPDQQVHSLVPRNFVADPIFSLTPSTCRNGAAHIYGTRISLKGPTTTVQTVCVSLIETFSWLILEDLDRNLLIMNKINCSGDNNLWLWTWIYFLTANTL